MSTGTHVSLGAMLYKLTHPMPVWQHHHPLPPVRTFLGLGRLVNPDSHYANAKPVALYETPDGRLAQL